MKVYLYDTNNIYCGEYDAQESPLEPGVYIAPSSSTTTPPPVTANKQVAIFKQDKWRVESDYRGEVWYDKATGEEVVITDVGIPPTTLQPAPIPPSSLELWQVLQEEASSELGESDIIVIRCYERGLPVPAEWVDYREALRVIKRTPDGDSSVGLPAKPLPPDFS